MENGIEQLKADVRAVLDWTALQFPEAMFPKPKDRRHGTVDGCTARGVRHAVELARIQLERTFALRESPQRACPDCLRVMPGLVKMELYKHGWNRTTGPLADTGISHWSKITGEEVKGISRRCTTLRAVCGVTFGYEVDSGD